MEEDGSQHWGDSPTLFEKRVSSLKSLVIGLVKVERLGQRLNVPTQGWKVAQTGDERPFSLIGAGSRSPAGNQTRAALVRGRRTSNQPPEHPHKWEGRSLL